MFFKKGLGIGLIFTGVYLILTNAFITGAVVGLGTENMLSMLGVFVFVIGVVMLFLGRRESRYTLKTLDSIFEDIEGDENSTIVLDTSGIIDYKQNLDEVFTRFSGRIYVPPEVVKEINKNRRLARRFSDYSGIKSVDPKEEPERFTELKKLSKVRLENTRKHQDYLVLKRIIGEEIVPKGVTNADMDRYEKIKEKIKDYLREDSLESTKENILFELEKHYKVSLGDIEVLTTALYNAAHKKQTRILAADSHIKDATADLIVDYPKLAKYLKYVDYREYQNAA